MSDFAVVIPAYNESSTIRDVARRALTQCRCVIVVDDGSGDDTAGALRDLAVVLLRNDSNSGKAASLWRGMQYALKQGADAVITLDGDGQHKPEDIPRFIEMARLHPGDIIIGARLADKSSFPRKRYYANKVANFWISWAAGYCFEDSQSGFRLYPAKLLGSISIPCDSQHGFVFESEILIEAARRGVRAISLPISAIYATEARSSHFRSVRDIVRITRMVAWKLIARGLYPAGLFRAFLLPRMRNAASTMGMDGMAMLVLSNMVILATGGVSLFWKLGRVYRIARATSADTDSSGCRLVLGMRLQGGSVTTEYALRLNRAVDLYQFHPMSKIMVLGGRTGVENVTEAQAGRNFLLDHGIPSSNILLEDLSRHTLENLRQARTLLMSLDEQEVVLISSRYHLARCHALALGLGMTHRLCAAENKLVMNRQTTGRMLLEAYFLHWYSVGKTWSRWTENRKMLDRIS